MIHLLIGSRNQAGFTNFVNGFEKEAMRIVRAESCQDILLLLEQEQLDLVIVDEKLSDMGGQSCIKKIVAQWPMVNSAVVSSLSDKAFHQAFEGMGVLMQLPKNPDKEAAIRLIKHVKDIMALTKESTS